MHLSSCVHTLYIIFQPYCRLFFSDLGPSFSLHDSLSSSLSFHRAHGTYAGFVPLVKSGTILSIVDVVCASCTQCHIIATV